MSDKPQFRTIPVAMQLLWTVLTLGIYRLWWIYRHTQIVNAHCSWKIPMLPVHLVIAIWIAVLVLMFQEAAANPQAPPAPHLTALMYVANLIVLVLSFTIRVGINQLAKAEPGSPLWLSLVWTFLFEIFYLQFKINQVLRHREANSRDQDSS